MSHFKKRRYRGHPPKSDFEDFKSDTPLNLQNFTIFRSLTSELSHWHCFIIICSILEIFDRWWPSAENISACSHQSHAVFLVCCVHFPLWYPSPLSSWKQEYPIKGVWMEHLLMFSALKEEDFNNNYTCRAYSDRGPVEGYFTLLQTGTNVCAIAIICNCFWKICQRSKR